MSVYDYIQTVKSVLESLEAPEIVEIGNFDSIVIRLLDCLDKTMPRGGTFHVYTYINPTIYNDEFKAVADVNGLVWAYWRTVQIPELMELAMEDYFSREGPIECNIEDWKELGEVVLENVYAAEWPDHYFQKPSDCSICSRPMWKFVITPCGHCYHHECLERWIINEKKITCPLCRGIL